MRTHVCDYCGQQAHTYIINPAKLRACLECNGMTGNPFFIKPTERSRGAMLRAAQKAEAQWKATLPGGRYKDEA